MTTYATEIRDLAADILSSGNNYLTVRKNWGWPLDPAKLPALSIFVPRETLTPEGDGNAAEPKFIHDMTLGVIISTGFATPEELDADTEEKVNAALTRLLTNPTFLREFESVERIEQTTVFDKDAETFIVEASFNITIRFRTDWPPNVPDNFESVSVTSRPLGKDEKTPPTELIINLPQE